jgi:hypothetical protein
MGKKQFFGMVSASMAVEGTHTIVDSMHPNPTDRNG